MGAADASTEEVKKKKAMLICIIFLRADLLANRFGNIRRCFIP
jgi:hypothetical protein